MSDINWNETAVYEFMRFEREPERRVFPDRDITKLAKAGLIQENETGDWTLTQTGEDELANIRQHFNSGKLSELPLKVRNYYFDWRVYDEKKLPVKELSKVALHDRSAEIRKKAATMLNKFSKLDKETSNGLAHDEDYQIRLMAAKNADPHLFFEESDERVVKTLIYNHNFDKECVEHWLDNPNSQIRVQAALLTEDGKVDEVLSRLNPQDVAHVLACKPQWATCERVMNAWENADEAGRTGWSRSCATCRTRSSIRRSKATRTWPCMTVWRNTEKLSVKCWSWVRCSPKTVRFAGRFGSVPSARLVERDSNAKSDIYQKILRARIRRTYGLSCLQLSRARIHGV